MPSENFPNVLLADDHAMMRDGLRSLIEVDWPDARFVETRDHASTLAALAHTPALDLAVIDVRMPGMRGTASFAEFRGVNSATPIVVVTGLDDPGLAPSLIALGAAAVVKKEATGEALLAILHRVLDKKSAEIATSNGVSDATAKTRNAKKSLVGQSNRNHQGSHGLSDRQRDMLRLLHEGLPNKLIARRLGIAETTVKGHLHGLYDALNVHSRIEAMTLTRDWLL